MRDDMPYTGSEPKGSLPNPGSPFAGAGQMAMMFSSGGSEDCDKKEACEPTMSLSRRKEIIGIAALAVAGIETAEEQTKNYREKRLLRDAIQMMWDC